LLAALIANITIAQAYCGRCATDILPSPRVPVADRCREEFDEAPGGSLTGAPDRGWQPFKSSPREIPRGIGTSSALIVAAHGNLDGGNQTPLGQKEVRRVNFVVNQTFVSGCPSFETVSNEKVRFLRFFSSPDRCLITFFMIRRRKRLSRTALAGPERTVKGGQKLPRAYRRKR
jgi:hypothetical protein